MASSIFRRAAQISRRPAWIGTSPAGVPITIGATVDVTATVSADLAVDRPLEAFVDVLALLQGSLTVTGGMPQAPTLASHATSSGTSADPTQWTGLVGAWAPFLGVQTPSLQDVSGAGHVATLVGLDAGDWSTGVRQGYLVNGILTLDGTTSYLDWTSTTLFDFANADFTVAQWFKTTPVAGSQYLMNKRGMAGAPGGWFIRVNGTTGAVEARLTDSGANTTTGRTSVGTYGDNAWHLVVATFHTDTTTAASNAINLYVDGVLDQGTAMSPNGPYSPTTVSAKLGIVADLSITTFLAGPVDDIRVYNRILTAPEILDLYTDPYGLYTLTAVAYTLTLDAGSYSTTGSSTTLAQGHVLTANSGSVSTTGSALTLAHGYLLDAQPTSYSVNGAALTFVRNRAILADASPYSVAGTDVTLTRLGALVLSLEAGTSSVTGTPATLTRQLVLAALSSPYSTSGSLATLAFGHAVSANAGSYSTTGTAITLFKGVALDAQGGTYSTTGTPITLLVPSRTLSLNAGALSTTGSAITLQRGRIIDATVGSYSQTGTDLSLRFLHVLTGLSSSHFVSGTAVALGRLFALSASNGAYVHTGAALTINRTRGLVIGSTSYLVSGQLVDLQYAQLVPTFPVLRVDAALRDFDRVAEILSSHVTADVRDFDKVAELA